MNFYALSLTFIVFICPPSRTLLPSHTFTGFCLVWMWMRVCGFLQTF